MNSSHPVVSSSCVLSSWAIRASAFVKSRRRSGLLALALCGVFGSPVSVSAQLEERVAGPVLEPDTMRQFNPYSVSPRGARLATLVRKGSRVAVALDGAEGPRFDQVVPPTFAHIDPRSAHAVQGIVGALTPLGPGYTQSGYGRAGPVVFSRDGKRFAYIAREAQEWVLMADGKEMLRLPAEGIVSAVTIQGPSGTVDMRLEFTGETGKHLLFARSVYGGFELWMDGKKMPGLYSSAGDPVNGFTDPAINADGSRIAYVAQIERDKQALIVDGKPASYFGTNPRFSADGKTLYTIGQVGPDQVLFIEGKPAVRGAAVRLFLPASGSRYGAIVTPQSAGGAPPKNHVVIDGAKIDATDVSAGDGGVLNLVFSPDGKHYAAACKVSQNVAHVVLDGKKLQRYDSIEPASLRFSPDGARFGYVAQSAGKSFVVIGEDESEAFDAGGTFAFSPDGKRVAWAGVKFNSPGGMKLFVDGKVVGAGSTLIFSPDSAHYAFTTEPHKEIHLDGKNTGLRGDKFTFSPDGKRFVVYGHKSSVDPKLGPLQALAQPEKVGLFVDGQHVWGTFDQQNLRYRAFTPDSRHLLWMSEEPAAGARAGPGKYEWVTYLDGNPVARFDRESTTLGFIYTAANYQFMDALPAWHTDADGTLTFLGPVDDTIKRFTLRTASGVGIEAMLAEAAAAPARAAAAEAEAKKKAEEAAAAKRAKAAADAAEAAAKQKAENDAALAKRKAENDAALAKRKAEYDAALEKRKADYEAAVAKRKADYEAKLKELEAARKAKTAPK